MTPLPSLLAAVASRRRRRQAGREGVPSAGVFWRHIGSFTVYKALIDYLLRRRKEPVLHSLDPVPVAVALHSVASDFGLREHHQHLENQIGRWVLAAAGLLGAAPGRLVTINEVSLAVLTGPLRHCRCVGPHSR